jgi:hypothetical protein
MRVRKVDDLSAIETLSDFEEAASNLLADVLIESFDNVAASVNQTRFLQLLRARNIAAADFVLSWGELADIIGRVSVLMSEQIRAGGQLGLPPAGAELGYSFDASHPLAVQSANARAANLITNITNEQRTLIRDVIARSVRDGLTVDDVQFIVSQSIGLTPRFAAAVDRRYRESFAALRETGLPARQARAQARSLASEYHDYLLQVRARSIARTEILSAHNEGRWLGWEDAIADGIAPTNAMKRWTVRVPQLSESPCPICLPIDGEEVPWDEPFSVGVMMPPLHPNCVCTSLLIIGAGAEYLPVGV